MGEDDLVAQVDRGRRSAVGEPLWHMPLPAELRTLLDSRRRRHREREARQHGRRDAGRRRTSSGVRRHGRRGRRRTSAIPWAHLDIAGRGEQRRAAPTATSARVRPESRCATLLALAEDFSTARSKVFEAGRPVPLQVPHGAPLRGTGSRTHSRAHKGVAQRCPSRIFRPRGARRRSGGYAAALRAARAGSVRRPDREGQSRRHLPARRLHPDQGAAARRRGRRCRRASPPSSASTPTSSGIDIAAVTDVPRGHRGQQVQGPAGAAQGARHHHDRGRRPLTSPDHRAGRRRHDHRQERHPRHRAPTRAASPASRSAAGSSPPSRPSQLDFVPKKVARARRRRHRRRVLERLEVAGAPTSQIIEALPHLVPNEDESVSKQFERAYRKRGINFSLGVRFQSVTQDDNGVVVTLEDGQTFDGELLLVAVGRGPSHRRTSASRRSASPWIAASSSRTSASQTSIPGVYAVGDIVPGLQLAHRGFQQGIFVAEEIAGLNPVVVERRQHPRRSPTATPRSPRSASARRRPSRSSARDKIIALRLQPRRQRQEPHHRHLGFGQGRAPERRPRASACT